MKRTTERRIAFAALLLVLVGALAGCGGTAPATPAPDLGPNLLIESQEPVSLKRDGWTDYVPVSLGAKVRQGDLIRPDEGQEVKILCSDLSLKTVKGESGCPCKAKEPVLVYGPARMLTPRGQDLRQIPYILYPRNTAVLDERPALRWHDTGASGYTVEIVQGGRTIWQQKGVPGTEMRYPDDAPALQPGADYLLTVTDETSGHHSGEDPAKGLGFQVLGAEEQATVEAQRDQILALPVDEPARRFALAVYYAGQRLRGDALAILDEVSAGLDSPAVHLWRGDLLAAMQLPDEAEAAYRAALAKAQAVEDRETEAAAQVGLCRVTGQADWLEKAVQAYEALGDQDQADKLRAEGCQ